MMERRIAAFAAAAVLTIGVGTPASAQSCETYGSQKEAQQALEQVGDMTGALDPDFNGFACEGAFTFDSQDPELVADEEVSVVEGGTVEDASRGATSMATEATGADLALSSEMSLNQDGPVTTDAAAGDSGTTTDVSTDAEVVAPGANDAAPEPDQAPLGMSEDGTLSAGDASVSTEGDTVEAVAGDAVAVDSPEGGMAMAGDAVAVDERDPLLIKPKAESDPKPESEPKVEKKAEAPIALPNTGVGAGTRVDGSLSLILGGLAVGVALMVRRRIERA